MSTAMKIWQLSEHVIYQFVATAVTTAATESLVVLKFEPAKVLT
jgi:hypothetical protein